MQRFRMKTLGSVAALSLATTAAAETLIDTCRQIDQPGAYRLTRDLTANGDCLMLNTSNITIDFAGHRITGNGLLLARGIAKPSSRRDLTNIVVRNGTVRKFGFGIELLDVRYARVEKMRVLENVADGILVSSGAVVTDNIVAENQAAGIRVRNGSLSPDFGGMISGNLVLRNSLNGFVTAGIQVEAAGATIERNHVRQNGANGIAVLCPAMVVGNNVSANNFFRLNATNLKLNSVGCLNKDNFIAQ